MPSYLSVLYPEQCSDPVTLNLQLMETMCLHFWHSTRETNRGRKKKHPNPNKSHFHHCFLWTLKLLGVFFLLFYYSSMHRTTWKSSSALLSTCRAAVLPLSFYRRVILLSARSSGRSSWPSALSLYLIRNLHFRVQFRIRGFPFVSKNRAKTG